jgi:hypothetical protein
MGLWASPWKQHLMESSNRAMQYDDASRVTIATLHDSSGECLP